MKVTRTLTRLEQRMHYLLQTAPVVMLNGQQNTAQLRQQYQVFIRKLHTLQQVLRLINLGLRLWKRQKIR